MKIGPTFNAGLGYLVNEKFGLKGRIDYNKIVTTSATQEDIQNSFALSLEGVVKLIQVFGEERPRDFALILHGGAGLTARSEEHTSELQSRPHLVCRLLLEKKKLK